MKRPPKLYKIWRREHPHGLAIFCSHRTHRRERERIYRSLSPWARGYELFALEPSRGHPLHTDDAKLKSHLEPLIALADIVLVAAVVAANNSKHMYWEAGTARELDRPTIPVQFDGQNALPHKMIELCGRNAVPTGLLRQRILEALDADRRNAFLAAHEPHRRWPSNF